MRVTSESSAGFSKIRYCWIPLIAFKALFDVNFRNIEFSTILDFMKMLSQATFFLSFTNIGTNDLQAMSHIHYCMRF